MNLVADQAVHLVITSPPYWQLKDYGVENQIGFHESYESYINNLNLVWQECHRVLHPGCRLCINIGDQFARSAYYGRYKVIPIRTEIIKFCEIMGLDYMGAIIWQKVTTCHTTGGAVIMGSFPYPRNGILKLDYEFILLFRKRGKPPTPAKHHKEQSALSKDEWNSYFTGHWHFAGVKQTKHLAMFPEELPARLIRMFSFPGETVLDPFLGSGTTALAARNLDRNSVGYEINAEFIPTIKDKLNVRQADLAGTEYVFLSDKRGEDLTSKIENLPYLFRDPHKLGGRIHPPKRPYGPSISMEEGGRETGIHYRVSKVVSPELVRLNNGWLVRLIGVKEREGFREQAMNYLRGKTMRQRVFVKFHDQKYDTDNNLLGYLYLSNKTFVNAHIIKDGFADVDMSFNYKYKDKFLKLCKHNAI